MQYALKHSEEQRLLALGLTDAEFEELEMSLNALLREAVEERAPGTHTELAFADVDLVFEKAASGYVARTATLFEGLAEPCSAGNAARRLFLEEEAQPVGATAATNLSSGDEAHAIAAGGDSSELPGEPESKRSGAREKDQGLEAALLAIERAEHAQDKATVHFLFSVFGNGGLGVGTGLNLRQHGGEHADGSEGGAPAGGRGVSFRDLVEAGARASADLTGRRHWSRAGATGGDDGPLGRHQQGLVVDLVDLAVAAGESVRQAPTKHKEKNARSARAKWAAYQARLALEPGDAVELRGLKGRPGLDGRAAVVVRYEPPGSSGVGRYTGGLYEVQVDGGVFGSTDRPIRVRRGDLRPVIHHHEPP